MSKTAAVATIAKHLRSASHRHRVDTVFDDWIALIAWEIRRVPGQALEVDALAHYQAHIERLDRREYTMDQWDHMLTALATLQESLATTWGDPLGQVFHALELHNTYQGQFFTPYEISRCMAAMTVTASVDTLIDEQGWVSVLDPACGAGSQLISFAEAVVARGHDRSAIRAVGVDIDYRCVLMSYIQTSMLGIPAVIHYGNSLSDTSHGMPWKTTTRRQIITEVAA
jgi:hypothetical protein